jgi:biotin transport system substrate-specific component
MRAAQLADSLERWRGEAFARRAELTWPAQLGLAAAMACLTGLMAQLRIYLPGTPVPVTGQTFAVLLAGALLGGAWGGASQLLYVGGGVALCELGVSWFSGATGTAGYFLGFVPAAILIGAISHRFAGARRFAPMTALMLAGDAIILAFGAAFFAMQWGTGFAATLNMAVVPFLAPDIVKVLSAAAIASALLPKARV